MSKRSRDSYSVYSGRSSEDEHSSIDSDKRKKRKSRWSADASNKTYIPGMPTQLPQNMSSEQEKLYILELQVEDITRRLRTGDLGIPTNPEDRSPSPEPVYNNEGKRMNTREYRVRRRLEEDRHKCVQKILQDNSSYKPPSDYKPLLSKVVDKVFIPQDEHPEINFVGLLIGPRGNTLKMLEKETGAKIIIRGKGSVKEGKVGRKDGLPMPGEDEALHAYVSSPSADNVHKAVKRIQTIIKEGIEVPESDNDLRKQQLRELALLNGTLRDGDLVKLKSLAEAQTIATNTILCSVCGGAGHLSTDCKFRGSSDVMEVSTTERAKMDSEYTALMAELGVSESAAAALLASGQLDPSGARGRVWHVGNNPARLPPLPRSVQPVTPQPPPPGVGVVAVVPTFPPPPLPSLPLSLPPPGMLPPLPPMPPPPPPPPSAAPGQDGPSQQQPLPPGMPPPPPPTSATSNNQYHQARPGTYTLPPPPLPPPPAPPGVVPRDNSAMNNNSGHNSPRPWLPASPRPAAPFTDSGTGPPPPPSSWPPAPLPSWCPKPSLWHQQQQPLATPPPGMPMLPSFPPMVHPMGSGHYGGLPPPTVPGMAQNHGGFHLHPPPPGTEPRASHWPPGAGSNLPPMPPGPPPPLLKPPLPPMPPGGT